MSTVRKEDGYMVVDVGDGAQMTCPTGELEHRLRYSDSPPNLAAAGAREESARINHAAYEKLRAEIEGRA